jgi:membrane protein implicated in regulation of membrane protease activity
VEVALATILLLAVVALVVVRPLVSGVEEDEPTDAAVREELEAAKEAKYREIRDAQLDREMGKLADEDYRAIDRELRGEAIEILKRLDELDGKTVRYSA